MELVWPPHMTAGAVGKQVQLLFFDAILGFATGAVDLVIQVFRLCLEVGHQIARVTALCRVLGFDDDAPAFVPRAGRVLHLMEAALFLPRLLETLLSSVNKCLRLCGEAVIARDTDDIVDTMTFAPAQHLPAAEA